MNRVAGRRPSSPSLKTEVVIKVDVAEGAAHRTEKKPIQNKAMKQSFVHRHRKKRGVLGQVLTRMADRIDRGGGVREPSPRMPKASHVERKGKGAI